MKTTDDRERMIAFVSRLKEVDCDGTEPLIQPVESGENVFREDVCVTASQEEPRDYRVPTVMTGAPRGDSL